MNLYLIRHGIATERGIYAEDSRRPLVDKGIKKVTKVAKHLLSAKINFDLILTSPLVRAYQTAEILQAEGLSPKMETFTPLQPDGNIEEWLQWLQQWRENTQNISLALVGHQPDLGNWAEMLIWGAIAGRIEVKKSGVIGLALPPFDTPIARSSLFLLSSPKWMS